MRTTGGTKILADWKPDFDATVVAKLKAAGAINLGKTNMHEWALGGTTINPFFGTTRNPWDMLGFPADPAAAPPLRGCEYVPGIDRHR